MFIVTLLLENLLAWMRSLSGTTSLRALLYFDEVFGFFPSHPYNPPSKEPLLRLLKQARAFGLGVILATQNPADIDYKGLANAGTWFIGKLQTENDKDKVLQGLENLTAAADGLNLRDVDRLLSSLGRRVFLMHNVHNQGGPLLLHTRWAMSYLRGPLTRQQIRDLLAAQRAQQPAPAASPTPPPPASLPEMPPSLPEMPLRRAAPPPPTTLPEAERTIEEPTQPTGLGVTPPPREPVAPPQPEPPLPAGLSLTPPVLPSSVPQFFLPPSLTADMAVEAWQRKQGRRLPYERALIAYEPVLLAQAEVRFADRKSGLAETGYYAYQVRDVPRAGSIAWDEHRAPYTDPHTLTMEPGGQAAYGELPPALSDPRRLTALQRDLEDYLYRTAALIVLHNPELDLYGTPGMTRRDFLVQAGTLARQRRDAEVDAVVARYDKIFDKIEDQLQRTARALAAEQQELETLRNEEMWTTGEAMLSLLRGRTTYTLSRMSRARRFRERAHSDVYEAEQRINELEAELEATQQAMEDELRRVHEKWTQVASTVQEYRITPYKKDIFVSAFGLGWVPYWLLVSGDSTVLLPAWQS
jgi:prefoldin subunit 5